MRKTWRATGSAVGLALAALQGAAAHAQTYYETAPSAATVVQPPLVVGAAPIYDPAAPVVSAPVVSAPVVTAPVVSAPAPVVFAAPPSEPTPVQVSAPAPAPIPVAASAEAAVIQLEPIDVAGAAFPASSGAVQIDGERLFLESGPRLDDALREIPGVFTRANMSQPGVAANIRGFEGSGRVNMMVDGVRQNFRFTGHEAQGFTYVDPSLLAGIDVSRGAETGVGGGGLAGSVNFRTLGVSDIVRPGQTIGALTRLTWGDNGVGLMGMAGGGLRFGGFGLAGAFSYRDSDDYENGAGVTAPRTGQELRSGLVKGEAAFGDHSLNVGGVFYENDFASNSYNQTLSNRTITGGYRYNPENDLIDLRANLRFNETEMEYLSSNPPSPFATAAGRVIKDRGFGGDVSNRSVLNFGPAQLTSTNGVEYFRDDISAVRGGVNPGDGEAAYWAAFTDNTLNYGIFDLNAGLRYDHYKLKGSGYVTSTIPYDVDNSDSFFNPSVTLGVEPIEGVRPYAKWARSMRAPTLQETMLGGTHPPGGGTSASFDPNLNLKPERQQTIEAGVLLSRAGLLQPGDSLTGRANYYWMNVDDYVVADLSGGSVRGRPTFVNVPGASKLRGFELEGAYDAGPYFVRASYAHMDAAKLPAQIQGLGASQYQPDDTVSVTAGVRLFNRKLTLGGGYQYVSGGLVGDGGGGAVQDDTSYGLFDLFADYDFNDNFRLGAKVTNVGDKEYTPWLATSGAGQGRTFYVLGEARF